MKASLITTITLLSLLLASCSPPARYDQTYRILGGGVPPLIQNKEFPNASVFSSIYQVDSTGGLSVLPFGEGSISGKKYIAKKYRIFYGPKDIQVQKWIKDSKGESYVLMNAKLVFGVGVSTSIEFNALKSGLNLSYLISNLNFTSDMNNAKFSVESFGIINEDIYKLTQIDTSESPIRQNVMTELAMNQIVGLMVNEKTKIAPQNVGIIVDGNFIEYSSSSVKSLTKAEEVVQKFYDYVNFGSSSIEQKDKIKYYASAYNLLYNDLQSKRQNKFPKLKLPEDFYKLYESKKVKTLVQSVSESAIGNSSDYFKVYAVVEEPGVYINNPLQNVLGSATDQRLDNWPSKDFIKNSVSDLISKNYIVSNIDSQDAIVNNVFINRLYSPRLLNELGDANGWIRKEDSKNFDVSKSVFEVLAFSVIRQGDEFKIDHIASIALGSR